MNEIAILGTGPRARMVFWCLRDLWPGADIVFVDDLTSERDLQVGGRPYPIIRDWKELAAKSGAARLFVLGVTHPETKQVLVQKALKAGLAPAPALVHPEAYVQSSDCRFAAGAVVMPKAVILAECQIDSYVTIASNVTIGPCSHLAEYSTLFPGAVLSGSNTIGKSCLIESGVTMDENVVLADRVHVGTQSCIIKDVDVVGARVAGVPARFLKEK